MALIGARHVTLQICILYNPENSVILLSANLGLDTLFLTQRSTKPDISAEIPIYIHESCTVIMGVQLELGA